MFKRKLHNGKTKEDHSVVVRIPVTIRDLCFFMIIETIARVKMSDIQWNDNVSLGHLV